MYAALRAIVFWSNDLANASNYTDDGVDGDDDSNDEVVSVCYVDDFVLSSNCARTHLGVYLTCSAFRALHADRRLVCGVVCVCVSLCILK